MTGIIELRDYTGNTGNKFTLNGRKGGIFNTNDIQEIGGVLGKTS
jgi:hypothetical protein